MYIFFKFLCVVTIRNDYLFTLYFLTFEYLFINVYNPTTNTR